MRFRPAPIALFVALALALALALVLPTLGGGTTVRIERPAVRFTLDEYSISPQRVSMRPGRIKLIMDNRGELFHNLRVETIPDELQERGKLLGGTSTAQPGEKVTAKLKLKPGTYRILCTLANHESLGMYGTLVVEGEPLR
ncbi:MAG TPA: plastocyanin/azurin family copper-binding protein [Solirubrobacteraceae bacterium]|nr:plastocyanin/azurin family copper-binding protein [Solirubrobacteraceae bacterium]